MKKFSFDEIIIKRRSVRAYEKEAVPNESLRQIIETARFAPSAHNTQPWRFVAVTDKQKVSMIFAKALGGIVSNSWGETAPAFIVACAKKSFLVHILAGGVKRIPYHYLDMGTAIEHILLKAAELGLGTCWIGWFNERAVRSIFSIPRALEIVSLIAIGYPSQQKEQQPRAKLKLDDILFWNRYGEPLKSDE